MIAVAAMYADASSGDEYSGGTSEGIDRQEARNTAAAIATRREELDVIDKMRFVIETRIVRILHQ